MNLLVFENFFWILPDDVNRIMSKKIYYKSFYQNKGEFLMQSTDSDEVYEYFRKYGQQMGFGIFRRDTRKHTYGQPISYRFTCARSGKSRRKEDPIIERINSAPKTQSPAQMTARFRPDGLYYITEVVLEHNHEMMTSSYTRFLRCNRKVVAHGKEVHEDNQKSGVSHKKSCQPRVPVP